MSPQSPAGCLPLSHIKVIDLTLARAGPTCVRHLADWGADVVRIEPPGAAEGEIVGEHDSCDYQNLHRNKRAITLNLKTAEGLEVFYKLVAEADVVIENMRADVKHRLGIDYDKVSAANPRIVYGSISGFGQEGPYASRAGVDQIAQGMGGLMSITGLPGQGPVRVGIPIADLTAGNMLALGVMVALLERERTGRGRWVTTSLLESMVFMLDFQATRWLLDGEVAGQAGNDHPIGIPTGVFPTQDKDITLAASSPRIWERFCETVGHPEWPTSELWGTREGRSRNRAALNAAIAEITATNSSEHWVRVFNEVGIPCGPINTIDQVFADGQVQFLGLASPVEHPRHGSQRLVRSPIHMPGTEAPIRRHSPGPGEHTLDVLASLGYGEADIQALKQRRVI